MGFFPNFFSYVSSLHPVYPRSKLACPVEFACVIIISSPDYPEIIQSTQSAISQSKTSRSKVVFGFRWTAQFPDRGRTVLDWRLGPMLMTCGQESPIGWIWRPVPSSSETLYRVGRAAFQLEISRSPPVRQPSLLGTGHNRTRKVQRTFFNEGTRVKSYVLSQYC